MSTIVSTVLIAAPPAFLSGWILSKVVFRHISLTRPNAIRGDAIKPPASFAAAPANTAGTAAGEQSTADGRRVKLLRQKLAGAQAEAQSLRTEMQLLKEAAAEREHTVLELKRKLKVQLAVPEQSLAAAPARQKQFVQMLEDRLATHEQHIEELKHELKSAETRGRSTTQRFRKWRQKFKPMARQFRQQRKMIGELREELRRRDLEQQRLAEVHAGNVESLLASSVQQIPLPVVAPAEVMIQAAGVAADQRAVGLSGMATECESQPADFGDSDCGDDEREDLQVLRGVGPALRKKLNEKGIYRLRQIALMSPQELHEVGKSLGISRKLLARHGWIRQARSLLNMPALPVDEKIEA
jgi:predicted flap endonuclease-1-like 5' DNA nuclease